MRNIALIISLTVLCSSCKTNTEKDTSYSFYDSSNYYIKDSYLINDSIKYAINNSLYSVENFLLLDNSDFLNNEAFDFYLIFFKDYFFQDRGIMFTLKSYNGLVTFSKSIINTPKGDYLFHDKNIKQRVSKAFSMNKETWVPNSDTATIVINKTKSLLQGVSYNLKEPTVLNDNYSEALVFDGERYFIINTKYLDRNSFYDFEHFILDSTLKIDGSIGY